MGIATPVLIPVSEYLATSYRPDCEYIDGEIKERKLGETPHSTIQTMLSVIFHANRIAWGARSFSEQRVQTSETHFRVPDIAVIRLGTPGGPVSHHSAIDLHRGTFSG
jgi:hypothetical protein